MTPAISGAATDATDDPSDSSATEHRSAAEQLQVQLDTAASRIRPVRNKFCKACLQNAPQKTVVFAISGAAADATEDRSTAEQLQVQLDTAASRIKPVCNKFFKAGLQNAPQGKMPAIAGAAADAAEDCATAEQLQNQLDTAASRVKELQEELAARDAHADAAEAQHSAAVKSAVDEESARLRTAEHRWAFEGVSGLTPYLP